MAERAPRLGFLGVGWIGRQRMQAACATGACAVAAVADSNLAAAHAAAAEVGCEAVCADLEALLGHELDGVVIATPTGLHAAQVQAVLARGLPVFCQKPLARTAAECRELVEHAREQDLLLGVDMSYRHLTAVASALERLRAGDIGRPYLADLTFHNAYGPDKPWVRDLTLAGGGAMIDLGLHLLDLARLFLGELDPVAVHAELFAGGRRLGAEPEAVEDLALAQVTLARERMVRVACSWWLPAGTDAVIDVSIVGEQGALIIRNVGGSFYDFEALLTSGRTATRLAASPDDWGGRALIEWATQLARHAHFDDRANQHIEVASVIDAIYGRALVSA